jgi:hypothetical protein
VRKRAVGWADGVYLGVRVPAGQGSTAGFSGQMRGGGSILRARRMARWATVIRARSRASQRGPSLPLPNSGSSYMLP